MRSKICHANDEKPTDKEGGKERERVIWYIFPNDANRIVTSLNSFSKRLHDKFIYFFQFVTKDTDFDDLWIAILRLIYAAEILAIVLSVV